MKTALEIYREMQTTDPVQCLLLSTFESILKGTLAENGFEFVLETEFPLKVVSTSVEMYQLSRILLKIQNKTVPVTFRLVKRIFVGDKHSKIDTSFWGHIPSLDLSTSYYELNSEIVPTALLAENGFKSIKDLPVNTDYLDFKKFRIPAENEETLRFLLNKNCNQNIDHISNKITKCITECVEFFNY